MCIDPKNMLTFIHGSCCYSFSTYVVINILSLCIFYTYIKFTISAIYLYIQHLYSACLCIVHSRSSVAQYKYWVLMNNAYSGSLLIGKVLQLGLASADPVTCRRTEVGSLEARTDQWSSQFLHHENIYDIYKLDSKRRVLYIDSRISVMCNMIY